MWDALVAAWQRRRGARRVRVGRHGALRPDGRPRGGALTLGLGLVEQLAVIPHHDTWSEDKAKRTLHIAPAGLPVVGVDARTALIRDPDGTWHASGVGQVATFVDGQPAGLDALP